MSKLPMYVLALLVLTSAPAYAGDDDVVDGPLAEKIDRLVQRETGGGYWGAALVAKGGKVILARGYGNADYGTRPNRSDTLFEIASASKPITAAAVSTLVQDGKLALDTTLAEVFRDVPKDKAGITVRELLTHTSGMSPNVGLPYSSPLDRRAFIDFVLAAPLASRRGEKFAYFNSGYALLAAMVEEVTGKGFEAYVEKKVFGPAKMSDTGFIGDRDLDRSRASTRLSERAPGSTACDWFWSWGYRGMGGVVTTVWDLHRLDRALRDGKVLGEEMSDATFHPEADGYSLGWRIDTTARGTRKAHHSGGVEGYACNVVRYLDEDALVVLLSNGRTNIHELTQKIEAALFPSPSIRVVVDAGPFTLSEYKGLTFDGGVQWSVAKDGDTTVLGLKHSEKDHVFCEIHLPPGAAKALRSQLAAYAGRRHSREKGMESGVYLNPYDVSTMPVVIEGALETQVMPSYRGRDAEGRSIVDDRATLIVVDKDRRQWPVMVKMDPPSLAKLLAALE